VAGSNAGFDAGAFRTAIRFAMTMGSPTQTVEKATFRWVRQQGFNPQDPAHRPYSWTQTPATDTTPDDVVLDNVAVEFATNRAGGGTSVGDFVPLRATVTLLDEEYALVEGADQVLLGGHLYMVSMTTVVAMFSVDVYQMFCERL
jgi:hypothetical protein